jgi:hypothetical protein
MTPAKTEQEKHNPWFAKAGAACSIVPISRFVGPNVFALKGGGYGCLFSLTGLDEEALTDLELESRVRSIEGALRGLPEGSCLYQYTRVMSGFDLPRQKQYQNKVTETFASDRVKGGVKVDQCGGAKGSHFGPEKGVGLARGEGLWSVAEEAFASARRVWWGGARSWGSVCGGSV